MPECPDWVRRDFFSCYGLLSARYHNDIKDRASTVMQDAYWLVMEDLNRAAMGLIAASPPDPLPGQASIWDARP